MIENPKMHVEQKGYDLKPCPFCGSDDVALFTVPAENGVSVIAGCCNCGAKTTNCFNENDASKAWNERHIAPPVETISKEQELEVFRAQLKPCKYCGNSPWLFTSTDKGETYYFIHCSCPDCYMTTTVYDDFKALRDFWNNGLKREEN